VEFCVTKGIPQELLVAESCFDPSFDHSPILSTLTADELNQEKSSGLNNKHTNSDFRRLVNERLTFKIPLSTEEDMESAAKFFDDTIQRAGWNTTSENKRSLKACDFPILIKQEIEEKKTPLRRKLGVRKNCLISGRCLLLY
jgi:hypothetical protein